MREGETLKIQNMLNPGKRQKESRSTPESGDGG